MAVYSSWQLSLVQKGSLLSTVSREAAILFCFLFPIFVRCSFGVGGGSFVGSYRSFWFGCCTISQSFCCLQLVETVIKQEMEMESKKEVEEKLDLDHVNTDDENEELAYEKWKLRELKHIKRDKDENEKSVVFSLWGDGGSETW